MWYRPLEPGTGFGLVLALVLAKYWLRGLCWLGLKKVQALASVSVLAWILALAKYWLRGLCWLRLKKVQALASASVLALDVV
jgi:uncharacterized protein YrrD